MDHRDRVLRALNAFFESPKARQPPEEKTKSKPKKKLAKKGGAQKRAGQHQRAAVKRARDTPGP